MTISLRQALLVLLLMRESIAALVNSILETYCKVAVHKDSNTILVGRPKTWLQEKHPVVIGYPTMMIAHRACSTL